MPATIAHLTAIPDELHHHESELESESLVSVLLKPPGPSPLAGCPRRTTVDIVY